MEIGPLVSKRVVSVGPGHSLREAASKMTEAGVGSALVDTDHSPGIITERDLLRAISNGANPDVEKVEDYMTAVAITGSITWDVTEAARRMIEGNFRHLVVLGTDGKPYGMLSIRDLVKGILEEMGAPAPH